MAPGLSPAWTMEVSVTSLSVSPKSRRQMYCSHSEDEANKSPVRQQFPRQMQLSLHTWMSGHLSFRCPHDHCQLLWGLIQVGRRKNEGPASWAPGQSLYVTLEPGVGQAQSRETSNSPGYHCSWNPRQTTTPHWLLIFLSLQISVTAKPQDPWGQGTRAPLPARADNGSCLFGVVSWNLPSPRHPSPPLLGPGWCRQTLWHRGGPEPGLENERPFPCLFQNGLNSMISHYPLTEMGNAE